MNGLKFIVFIFFLISFISCESFSNKKTAENSFQIQQDSIAKQLVEQKCNVCHALGKTEQTIIAPPLFAVRRQYMKFSMDKEDFITTMTDYVNNPQADKSLMKPAVEQFNVMPKQVLKPEELTMIVNYLYHTEMPKPDWFDAHEEKHRKGIKH